MSHTIHCWQLPTLWAAATLPQRAQTFLPPLLLPLSVFADHPFIPVMLSAGVLLVCVFIGLVRLLLLPFKWRDGTRLLAWRLPVSALLAVAVFAFIQKGTDRAVADLRDLMVTLRDERSEADFRWRCEPEDLCRLKIGQPPVEFTAVLSRDMRPDGTATYEGKFMPFQDSWVVFQIDEHGGMQAWSRTDLDTKPLDIQTLEPLADHANGLARKD